MLRPTVGHLAPDQIDPDKSVDVSELWISLPSQMLSAHDVTTRQGKLRL